MDILSRSKDLNNICDSIEKNENIYKVVIDGKKYTFKPASKEMGVPFYDLCFNELVISYLARFLKIDCVDVKMACYNPTNSRFKKEYGILMEDYNIKNYVAFLGSYFLEKYYDRLKEKNKLDVPGLEYDSKDDALNKMNNLKTIYVALNYFFSDYANRDKIIENIMCDLAKIVCLDYLTMQDDRTMDNWGILISIKKEPKLIKMFDNEMAFKKDYTPKLKTLNSYETKEESLINFLTLNDVFREEFINMYESLDIETFITILGQIEIENGVFPKSHKNYKENLIKKYTKNYEEIGNILTKINIESRGNHAR